MGFLDRLVGDMLQESTGLPVRRLVRKVGGGKILLAGAGALMAGGLIDKLGQSQGSARTAPPPAPGAVPPPPPPVPVPGTAPPPPPPPATAASADAASADAASADAADDELPQELTYVIVRTMAAAALADGELSDEEREAIHRRLGESNLSAEQIRQIDHDLVVPPTPAELAALAPGGEAREALYRFAALIVLADQKASEAEREWLSQLAAAFELPAERRQALEAELFAEDDTESAP